MPERHQLAAIFKRELPFIKNGQSLEKCHNVYSRSSLFVSSCAVCSRAGLYKCRCVQQDFDCSGSRVIRYVTVDDS